MIENDSCDDETSDEQDDDNKEDGMMNDSYLASMFCRLQCIMGSVVLFLKQLLSPKA